MHIQHQTAHRCLQRELLGCPREKKPQPNSIKRHEHTGIHYITLPTALHCITLHYHTLRLHILYNHILGTLLQEQGIAEIIRVILSFRADLITHTSETVYSVTVKVLQPNWIDSSTRIRQFPFCLSPLFQCESKCEAFHMEISFIHTQILVHLHVNKTNFHMKGFTLGLALKQRRKATRKSPIVWVIPAFLF